MQFTLGMPFLGVLGKFYRNRKGLNKKIYNFDPFNVLLAIATNIPVLLKTGFVVQGHIFV